VAVEEMDVERVVEGLNRALALQLRSVVQLTLAAGSVTGLAHAALAERYGEWARAELVDAALLVEKIVSVGGEPDATPAEPKWNADPAEMGDRVAESEDETIEALRRTIEPAGDLGPGEALEHLLEHMIMRKQIQVDRLRRALAGG
jgi:bacterioferritin (cytochrome b1)